MRHLIARLFENHRRTGKTEIHLLAEFIVGLLYQVRDGRLCSVFGGPARYGTSGELTFLDISNKEGFVEVAFFILD